MESWVVGYDGDADVERHAGSSDPLPGTGKRLGVRVPHSLHLRVVSDYI